MFCSNAISSKVYRLIGFKCYVRHPVVGLYQSYGNYADIAIFGLFLWTYQAFQQTRFPYLLTWLFCSCSSNIYCPSIQTLTLSPLKFLARLTANVMLLQQFVPIFSSFLSGHFSNAISFEICGPIDFKFHVRKPGKDLY